MTARAWPYVLLGCLVAPLVTWLPMLARQYPRLGLPQYPDLVQGLDFWTMQAFGGAAALVIASFCWPTDRWLAGAVGLAGFAIFYRGAYVNQTHAHYFILGVLCFLAVRQMPVMWHPMARDLLAISGAFQAVYLLQQAWLNYDLLWGPLLGGDLLPVLRPLGTLGTVAAAGGYVAITATLMPWWLLPLAGAAVWATHSLAAILALSVALTIRYVRDVKSAVLWGGPALATVAYALLTRSSQGHGHVGLLDTVTTRLQVWQRSLEMAWHRDPVMGLGIGGYPTLNLVQGPEYFREAHSEPIQWVCETGIIGAVVLIGWLIAHRHLFASPMWGGAAGALGIQSLVFFPFHVATVALLGVIVVACATPALEPSPVGGS